MAQSTLNGNIVNDLQSAPLRTDLPSFRAGDKIVVRSKIKEGEKFRIQAFEGVVISRKNSGIRAMFTVRKVSGGIGVERIFPLHSPLIEGIDVKSQGFVRRSRIYYQRDLQGKSARIQDRNLKLAAAQGGRVGSKADKKSKAAKAEKAEAVSETSTEE